MLHRRAARAKLQKSRKLKKTGVYVNIAKTGTSEVLFVPGYNTWGGGTKDPPQKQTWRLDEIKKRKTEIFKTSDFLAQIVASR